MELNAASQEIGIDYKELRSALYELNFLTDKGESSDEAIKLKYMGSKKFSFFDDHHCVIIIKRPTITRNGLNFISDYFDNS